MPIEIRLGGKVADGRCAIVDDDDRKKVAGINWRGHRAARSKTLYARGYCQGAAILMHRLIMDASPGDVIDHINGNGLDNRRANLRFVTRAENNRAYRQRLRDELWNEWESRL